MLQTECKIDNGGSTRGRLGGELLPASVQLEQPPVRRGRVSVVEGHEAAYDGYEGPEDCGGDLNEISWSNMCCGGPTCAYTDSTCATDPFMCRPFKTT